MKGRFRLKAGVRLIPGDRGGVVLRDSPFRALRVNEAAFRFLEQCDHGAEPQAGSTIEAGPSPDSMPTVCDRLCQAGILEWEPASCIDHPFVSIVVAVHNRADAIRECLESLGALDYAPACREIIVVDDGSDDDTPDVVRGFDVMLVELERNTGQSAARNAGVAKAKGEIIAFVDSDCIADPAWLRDLVPYFQDAGTALVGGYVGSYYTAGLLDRYEEAKSPLCMGRKMVIGYGAESDFYVPTCNMLVRRDAFLRVCGFNEGRRVGEDVDLCWRLKEHGFRLRYVPKGSVKHKHRNEFRQMFRRRFDYGTSEAVLHATHTNAAKRFPWNPISMAILAVCVVGLLTTQALVPALVPAMVLWDAAAKRRRYAEKIRISPDFLSVCKATLLTHFRLVYFLTYHVVRYYLLPVLIFAAVWTPLIPVVAGAILFTSFVEFREKRPRLHYMAFLPLFLMEQASYQVGAFWGSVRQRNFCNYRLTWVTLQRERRVGR
ncbi:MAG: mycofactocin biosynthesis glycosyltransferase MftF [Thermodesulfobacteriota bacterium]